MTPFEKFDRTSSAAGIPQALDELADYLTNQNRFHELFEVRKMQMRWQLGLPIDQWQSIDDLPESTGKILETRLLEACREVGLLFMQHGDVQAGWQYLQPVGDRALIREVLLQVDVTDENIDAIVEISVAHAVAPEHGFQMVLDRYGTCTAITTYESQLAHHMIALRRGPARLLVEHVHDELLQRVRQAIQDREPDAADMQLAELIEGRDWLFEGLSHHIDTTHLASTIKIARILDDPATINKALELAHYGKHLHEDFQYADEPPFANIYQDTWQFLRALSGADTEAALDRLKTEAERQISEQNNLNAAQWYIYLLDRLELGQTAVEEYLRLIHPNLEQCAMIQPVAPDLLLLASKYRAFEQVNQSLLARGDLLAYATSKAIERQAVPS